MAEFDYSLISVLFGIAGTFILLFSNILIYRKNIKDQQKYSLVSQMIGYLFLFDSFLYLLWPKISSEVYSVPSITIFSYWPYYIFITAGILISLYLVKEKDTTWGLEVNFEIKSLFDLGVFYSPAVLAFIALILNSDFLLILTIVAWFQFMGLLIKKY